MPLNSYKNAHTVQIQILEMQKQENEKYLKTKEEKRDKELSKLIAKQENESRVFEDKMASTFNEFKKKRALQTEK